MPTYRQAAGSDTWHWCRNCSSDPASAAKSEFHPGKERPRSGELCNQCLGKEKNGDCRL